jgi:hypothetical protein
MDTPFVPIYYSSVKIQTSLRIAMRFVLASIMLAMGLVLTGCHSTCDARGPSEECEIHHVLMRTELIDNDHPPAKTIEYVIARQQAFPHTYPFALPDQCNKCVVYICDDCVRAEKEWNRRHPNGK